MKKVQRVNFTNPETGNMQLGFGVETDGTWIIRTYRERVFNLKKSEINGIFESYNRSEQFYKEFFKK